jgi:hypothetical protein
MYGVSKALIRTYESVYFLNLGTRLGVNCQLHVPAALLPGKEHPYSLSRRLVRPHTPAMNLTTFAGRAASSNKICVGVFDIPKGLYIRLETLRRQLWTHE